MQEERLILGKWKPPWGLQWVFELLLSAILASGPSRVVKTEWLGILATSHVDRTVRSRGLGPSSEAGASWSMGPGTLALGLASFLSVRPPQPLPLPNGKIHVAFLLDSGRDTIVSVWRLTGPLV